MAPWATVTIPASAPLGQIVMPEAAKIDRAFPTTSSQAPSPAAKPMTEDISTSAPAEPDAKEQVRGIGEPIGWQGWITGQWTPLLVPQSMRPDLSEDERRELAEQRRELAEQLRAAAERLRNRAGAPSEEERQVWQAWRNGPGNLPRMLRLQQQTGAQSTFLEFEEIPQACIEAFGELSLNQSGISFSFPTHFPDDLDRFTVEHRRLDDFRAQLLLVGRNCRVEMTIGKAIRADGRWVSIQLDAIYPSG
jgi:hypothetical protein